MTHDLSTVEGATALMASSATNDKWTRNAIAIRDHNKYHVDDKWWHKIVLYTEPQFVKDFRDQLERESRRRRSQNMQSQ
jgi:hypothetical protein